jgi:hypothetical protein
MMQTARMFGAAMLALYPVSAQASPALSAAQSAVVAKSISALKHPEERRLASGWSNAKKVAEMICRPAALPALQKQVPGADRVFLGTDDPATRALASNEILTGTGQVRAAAGWRDFTFTCKLDPETGKAAGFKAVLQPAA